MTKTTVLSSAVGTFSPHDEFPDRATREEFLFFLRELVRFRSTALRPEAVQACAARICSWLLQHNLPFTVFDGGGTPSILVGENPTTAEVLLLAHYDVVEADYSLFDARCEAGIAWGRGCYDDKYAVALLLLLFRRHQAMQRTKGNASSAGQSRYALLLTGDEEQGGGNGAGGVSAFLKPDFCVALDGGDLKHIVTRQPGVLRLALSRRGKERVATSAATVSGTSPGIALAKDCIAVNELFAAMQSAALTPESRDRAPRCLLGSLCAGDAPGCGPNMARAEFDIRYAAPHDAESIRRAVASVVESQVDVLEHIPPLEHRDSPYLRKLLGYMPGAALSCGAGAGDAHYFAQRGVSCAVLGAEGHNSQHTAEEHLVLESAYELMRRLDLFLLDI